MISNAEIYCLSEEWLCYTNIHSLLYSGFVRYFDSDSSVVAIETYIDD